MIQTAIFKLNPTYTIYSDGRVFSKKKHDFLVGMVDASGYHCFNMTYDGRQHFLRTNRLIAEYFVPKPLDYNDKYVVNHKDGNKLNNDYSNLEWVTYSENIKHYYRNYKGKTRKAEYDEGIEGEEWRLFKGLSRYLVSNLGRVKSVSTNRVLKPDKGHAYARFALINDEGKRIHIVVHRLVYCAFTGDYDLDNYVIDHIDNNKRNNCLDNLQKLTPSQNSRRQARFQKSREGSTTSQ